jgi:hypothetical protein
MLGDLRDHFGLILLVNIPPGEDELLRKGSPTSTCITYDLTATDQHDPDRCDLGFRSLDDLRIASKRADLVYFGSSVSAAVTGGVICRFLQDDGIVVVDAVSSAISRSELATDLSVFGCSLDRVMTLRRLPGAFAVGYAKGADAETRVSGKLVGEFFEALGRVVVGSEVVVEGQFKRPEGVVGPYIIVAVEGAEFMASAASGDRELVAVDLSASGIRTLNGSAFSGCRQLAAVAFPRELEKIGAGCFGSCDALHMVDLTMTWLKTLGEVAFACCGVTRMSVPASLRELGEWAFWRTPLKVLDLSACAGISVGENPGRWLVEVSLPREGFKAAAKEFLQGSRVEVLRADIDETEIRELLPHLEGWGVDRLRVESPRIGVYEWQRTRESVLVELTDPVTVTAMASVKLTSGREIPSEWSPYLCVIDLSGLTVEWVPCGAFKGMVCLEEAVLPTGLRELPDEFFAECCRLVSVVTRYTALEVICDQACGSCRSLVSFPFPLTVSKLGAAFDGTSITSIDLTGTVAEYVELWGMSFLVELQLPRRCALSGVHGVSSLRVVTFGASFENGGEFRWDPREVRFESMVAEADFSPGLLEARVYGEVGCELGRETLPFPPP